MLREAWMVSAMVDRTELRVIRPGQDLDQEGLGRARMEPGVIRPI